MTVKLTPKRVEVMIKRHYDLKAIANHLGLTVEEVDAELRKLYSGKAYNTIISRLKANEKMARKLHPEPEAETETETDENIQKVEAETEIETKVESETEVEIPSLMLEPSDVSLEDVISAIADKQSQLITLERRHQTSASNRQTIRSRIDVKKKELLRLQENVKKIQLDVASLIEEFENEESKMKDFNSQMSEIKMELGQLEIQRVELETLSILVYKDGRIEIDNQELEPDKIPEEWTSIYHKFFGKDEVDALTGFEQKNLAKFFALLQVLPKGRKQDICFESNDMQAAFELLKGGILG